LNSITGFFNECKCAGNFLGSVSSPTQMNLPDLFAEFNFWIAFIFNLTCSFFWFDINLPIFPA